MAKKKKMKPYSSMHKKKGVYKKGGPSKKLRAKAR